MPLALLVGPANAGKVAALLDRYLVAIDREPVLIVPTGPDVARVERDLLARSPCLLGGWIGTFDDLFRRVLAGAAGAPRPPASDLQRSLMLAEVVCRASLNGLKASARFPGFADALGETIGELEAALVEPEDVGSPLAELYAAYLGELDRLGLSDRGLTRRTAAELVADRLEAWDGSPVFAYGFEDLSGVQWTLLEALAGRTEVTVSLPYEPARPAFASLERTASDLAALADGRLEELPAQSWYDSPALAGLERSLFEERSTEPLPLDGSIRFVEAAGSRAALELVAEDILGLVRTGTAPEEILVVCPSLDRARGPLETAFTALGVPYALEGMLTLRRTGFGQALLGLLRFAWLGGSRGDLFAFLRSPYSGLARTRADFVDGRLRGRAVTDPARVEEEARRLLGHGIPALDELRQAAEPFAGARSLAASMLRAAYGLESPPASDRARLDLRLDEVVARVSIELESWEVLGGRTGREHVVAALERAEVRVPGAREPGRVAVVDLMRARTRRAAAAFILGLEEGSFPRRPRETPFLPDERRRELDDERRSRRLQRPDQLSRDRYLFYTVCTRPWQRLTLVREAASDDGRPIEPSPFYEEIRRRFVPEDVARWTRRRPLSALAWDVDRAPTDRERQRAVAALAAEEPDEARALARANGWERKLERALAAFERPTRLTSAAVLAELGERTRFSVTDLERFLDCSSMWLFERIVSPKEVDARLDPRIRGGVAHQTLYRFYSGLPKRLGVESVPADRLDEALEFLGECLDEAVEGSVGIELSELERLELRTTLARDLEAFLRQEVELGFPLDPRRFEVSFGTSGAPVELQRGLELGGFTVSGKIDRIDLDPFSARGIVQDYKLGRAHGARDIQTEQRLQLPLYILALRDLVGIEPLGGLYRSLTGTREARGLVRADAADAVPELKKGDYLDEEAFWSEVEEAKEHARGAVARIRAGDVRHDPREGSCPSWCSYWTMCRVRRP